MKGKPNLEANPNLASSSRRTFMKVVAGTVGAVGGAVSKSSDVTITPAAAQSSTSTDYQTFDLGSVQLQSGVVFPNAKLAYKTYGELTPDKSNVIVVPSAYSGTHKDLEWQVAADKVLDPGR
jgi:hypothetical protein